jgi:hypothetical protein
MMQAEQFHKPSLFGDDLLTPRATAWKKAGILRLAFYRLPLRVCLGLVGRLLRELYPR